ncbi:MAG: transposase [Chloroflexi bacterium]|nr:transposase [Chloroflexota bacterium]
MNEDQGSVLEVLGQVRAADVGRVFREYLRGVAREILCGVMAEEVSALCGPAYSPDPEAMCYRSGSAAGYAYMESRREQVSRPRVRRRTDEGTTEETALRSYRAAQDPSEVHRLMIEAMLAAGSTRKVGKLVRGQRGSSRSQLSRLWRQVGREKFAELRHRPLAEDADGRRRDWLALVLDGIVLADDLVAIVAVGITVNGYKAVLDFELGASENALTASVLMGRLIHREFYTAKNRPLLVVLDGSEALRKATMKHFPDARIQRCLVHKERNLKRYLPRRHWEELHDLFDRLRKVQGAEAAIDVLGELDGFLVPKNLAALNSLHEAGADLIRIHLLDAPSTVHGTFLSTNLIENMINNIRRSSRRVNRWRPETDQAARWLATGLLAAEEGFRRVPNYRDLATLGSHLTAKRDEENLRKLNERLPDWLVEEKIPELDANEAASVSLDVDTADKVTVGSRS